jgi:hypothetical protein
MIQEIFWSNLQRFITFRQNDLGVLLRHAFAEATQSAYQEVCALRRQIALRGYVFVQCARTLRYCHSQKSHGLQLGSRLPTNPNP